MLSWDLVQHRSLANMQACLEQGPRAQQYYSDGFHYYAFLDYYPAKHRMLNNKSQTFSVEGLHADLRHYLRRLARRSRCFSRSYTAFKNSLSLFVYCHNQRQLAKMNLPAHHFALSDFAATCF